MDGRPPLAILAGVRVVSFTQFLLGPSGVQFLADLGADVVKVEPPGGRLWERNWSGADLFKNGVSVFFMLAHRNQRSLTLDLKHPEGRAVARRLVERADVLVQNFRPGVMARHGLDWETAKAINPRLIYVSASGYGESSPYRDRPGQDLLMQGLSGLASISGRADQPPTAVGTAVINQHGATLLALGVDRAPRARGRVGGRRERLRRDVRRSRRAGRRRRRGDLASGGGAGEAPALSAGVLDGPRRRAPHAAGSRAAHGRDPERARLRRRRDRAAPQGWHRLGC